MLVAVRVDFTARERGVRRLIVTEHLHRDLKAGLFGFLRHHFSDFLTRAGRNADRDRAKFTGSGARSGGSGSCRFLLTAGGQRGGKGGRGRGTEQYASLHVCFSFSGYGKEERR